MLPGRLAPGDAEVASPARCGVALRTRQIQKYADRKLDEFFGVDALQKAQAEQQPPPASDSHKTHE